LASPLASDVFDSNRLWFHAYKRARRLAELRYASRAVAWLAGITVAFAVAFHLVGFIRPPQPASYWTSLLYVFRSTISLTDNEVTLTAWGRLLQALLRLTGPVLLGLALLALRGRVKR